MTREEAIEQLNFMIETIPKEPSAECDSIKEWLDTDKDIRNALEMAIEALEAEPCVTPTRKKGHWIMTNDYLTTAYGSVDYVKCSCCGEDSLEEGNYCPNCGAKMLESQESEVER